MPCQSKVAVGGQCSYRRYAAIGPPELGLSRWREYCCGLIARRDILASAQLSVPTFSTSPLKHAVPRSARLSCRTSSRYFACAPVARVIRVCHPCGAHNS